MSEDTRHPNTDLITFSLRAKRYYSENDNEVYSEHNEMQNGCLELNLCLLLFKSQSKKSREAKMVRGPKVQEGKNDDVELEA